jgi:energy-coupling factor transporter ATP-binding protein EcfA2
MPIIEAKNLGFTYATAQEASIADVTFKVSRGEFIVLTGPSGCGKTTLCRCLNGLIPNFYTGELLGTLIIDGLDTRQHQTSELARHVGFVFQNPENQLFSLSIERDVAFGPENMGLSRQETRRRVDWALNVTGIAHLKDKAPYELSGGQQQRAAIACVLAMQPSIIVLDEPTSFLDPKSAEDIVGVIAKLNHDLGITIILVEHRLDLVSQYADRVMIMHKGRIVLDGAPSEVYVEQARLLGIGIPKVTLLFQLLRSDGFQLSSNPITVEEAARELEALLPL